MSARNSVLMKLVEAFEHDKESFALELHDNVLQTLASAMQYMRAAQDDIGNEGKLLINIRKAFQLVRQSIDAGRNLMGQLQPPVVERFGLVKTLNHELAQVKNEMGWVVQFETANNFIPHELELPLYRILREAILNAKKHSRTRFLYLKLLVEQQPAQVLAIVQDTGIGFDTSAIPSGRVGLISMQTRAKALGGECNINSSPGKGCTILVRLPIQEAGKEGDNNAEVK